LTRDSFDSEKKVLKMTEQMFLQHLKYQLAYEFQDSQTYLAFYDQNYAIFLSYSSTTNTAPILKPTYYYVFDLTEQDTNIQVTGSLKLYYTFQMVEDLTLKIL